MSLAHQDTAGRADFSTAIEKLHNAFGDKLSTGQALRAQHAATATYHPLQLPDAVLFAESRADVQQERAAAGDQPNSLRAPSVEWVWLTAAGTGDSAQALKEEMEKALEQAAKASAVETY